MTFRASAFVAAVVRAASSSAFAQQTEPMQTPAAATAKPADPNEVICEKQGETGSRLATKRVCMTRGQWADLKSHDRQETERVQVQRGAMAPK